MQGIISDIKKLADTILNTKTTQNQFNNTVIYRSFSLTDHNPRFSYIKISDVSVNVMLLTNTVSHDVHIVLQR